MKPFALLAPLAVILLLIAARTADDPTHTRLVLDKGVYTEGASFGDINSDGHPDLLAGPLWWEGPAFKKSHRYRAGEAVPAKGSTPISPPSGPAPRLPQGPPAKSKFLAAHNPGAPGEERR